MIKTGHITKYYNPLKKEEIMNSFRSQMAPTGQSKAKKISLGLNS